MAYDRYDRDERSRWSDDRYDRGRGERGFWDRAGDEVASWFGDEEAERRRREDARRDERTGDTDRGWFGGERERAQHRDREFGRGFGRDRDRERGRRDWYETRGPNERGGFSESDYNPRWRREFSSRERDLDRDRGYRPMTGDYGRGDYESEQFFAASGYGRGERGLGRYDRSQTPYGRDEYRRTSFAGSRLGEDRDFDPHYRSWRDRHLSDLDRDYDDYRRENQSRFESDFTSWRERRQQKRSLLGQIREHMEVVGSDDRHVDRVEKDRVILDCSADEAKNRWRDETRNRALFEREDQGEMGPRALNRSFEGTYR
jgi:hypothetical protein